MKTENTPELSDTLAEKLEKARMWRRAATRWLAVMDSLPDPAQRQTAAQRRTACIRQAAEQEKQRRQWAE